MIRFENSIKTQNPAITLNVSALKMSLNYIAIVHETSINIGEIDVSREMEIDPFIMTYQY